MLGKFQKKFGHIRKSLRYVDDIAHTSLVKSNGWLVKNVSSLKMFKLKVQNSIIFFWLDSTHKISYGEFLLKYNNLNQFRQEVKCIITLITGNNWLGFTKKL